jgi:hypothetical protein
MGSYRCSVIPMFSMYLGKTLPESFTKQDNLKGSSKLEIGNL